jgi:hypothetical protein
MIYTSRDVKLATYFQLKNKTHFQRSAGTRCGEEWLLQSAYRHREESMRSFSHEEDRCGWFAEALAPELLSQGRRNPWAMA